MMGRSIFEQRFTGSHVRPEGRDYEFGNVPPMRQEELERIGKQVIKPMSDTDNQIHSDMLGYIRDALVMGDLDVLGWHFKNATPHESLAEITAALQPYTHGEIAWILSGVSKRK